jgi:hypothetical protein
MAYLETTEYESYGLSPDTTGDWIAIASGMIDAYCRRAGILATQYVERLRVVEGSQTVRLSYLPLLAADIRDPDAANYGRLDWMLWLMHFHCLVHGRKWIRPRSTSHAIPAS